MQRGRSGGSTVWALLLLWAVLMPVLFAVAVTIKTPQAPQAQSSAGAPTQQLVHVCTAAHYNATTVICTRDDRTISSKDYATAEVVVMAAAGQTFTTTSLTITVSKENGQGAWVSQGTTPLDVGQSAVSASERLRDILGLTTASPSAASPGSGTYQIAAAAGATPLGATTVTLAP